MRACMFLGIGSGCFSLSILLLSVLLRLCLLGFLFAGGRMLGRVQWPGVAIRRYLLGRGSFVCSLWDALIAYWRQFPSPITLMVDRLRMCAFAVRMLLTSAILMRWLRCCRRHWYALFLVLNLLSSSLARTISAESLIVYRWLVIVDGRGASLNCVSSVLL